jgi:hypothetical protein
MVQLAAADGTILAERKPKAQSEIVVYHRVKVQAKKNLRDNSLWGDDNLIPISKDDPIWLLDAN